MLAVEMKYVNRKANVVEEVGLSTFLVRWITHHSGQLAVVVKEDMVGWRNVLV